MGSGASRGKPLAHARRTSNRPHHGSAPPGTHRKGIRPRGHPAAGASVVVLRYGIRVAIAPQHSQGVEMYADGDAALSGKIVAPCGVHRAAQGYG